MAAKIRKGGYIAQDLAQPSTRSIAVDGEIQSMKLDVRLYTYAGTALLAAARIYQGQTTNFRTPGGGFAPVYSSAEALGRTLTGCTDDSVATSPAETEHASYVFLLDASNGVHTVPHGLYVALARGVAAAPALAGQTLRLADWFVQLKDGLPDSVVNESYSQLRFDANGYVDFSMQPVDRSDGPAGATAPDDDSRPSAAEYAQMRALLFHGAESSAMSSPSNDARIQPGHAGCLLR